MTYPKRLIEVDLPIKRISAHARREKSIRHGHISTLHIWWARRPLAACRAVLCAALWPDPADQLCPEKFVTAARERMLTWAKLNASLSSPESLQRLFKIHKSPELLDNPEELRVTLLDFIADFANWDNSTNAVYLETARFLTQTAHEALGGEPGTRPLVVDPFAGGGSIPLEALRVGADAFASDLNPVAVLLNKVVLEYIPKYGKKLAEEVRKWGMWIKEQAEKELAEFYPKDPDGATPIAYLWARTINCEGPGCGAEVPLMRSLWLAKKGSRSVALRIVPKPNNKRVDFEIMENVGARDVRDGTVKRGSATCPCCGYTTPVTSVRAQLKVRKGGAADARMFCVVTTRPGVQGRFYRLPTDRDLEAVRKAAVELEKRKREHKGELSLVPDEILPVMSGVFNAPIYGHNTWGSLFSQRQLLTLTIIMNYISESGRKTNQIDGFSQAIETCLALALDRQTDHSNSGCTWNPSGPKLQHLFTRQALPMVWDYAESQPFGDSVGDWMHAIECVLIALENASYISNVGIIVQSNATQHPMPDNISNLWFTDPPYYNAVPYADLSDFFYVWLKRSIGKYYPDLFTSSLVDKTNEICEMSGWDPDRYFHKNSTWFEKQMSVAMNEGKRVLHKSGLGMVVFAHKSTTGWEAQLKAMVDAGWIMTGSWPIDTEMGTRLRAMDSAALASSVHLVCRPRKGMTSGEEVGDWRDVLSELPKRIHTWMPRLAAEGVVGADAIFACLGPALEIFSRYERVEKANGDVVTLREYLEQVWAAVSREALTMIFTGADASGFEEDARLTAMWLWTLSTGGNGSTGSRDEDETDESDEEESTGKGKKLSGFSLEYDAARKIAQGLGAHMDRMPFLVEIKGESARLLPVSERASYLFGKEQLAVQKKKAPQNKAVQLTFFDDMNEEIEKDIALGDSKVSAAKTTLDRVHQAMLLFAHGRGEALKRLLVEGGVGNDAHFWRLAQSLSALYPHSTEEKRWVDGLLARKKGLGL